MAVDVRPALAEVAAPTLVVHPTRDACVPIEHARYIAERIPGATMVELDSADHLIWCSDAIDEMTATIQGFLIGSSRAPERLT